MTIFAVALASMLVIAPPVHHQPVPEIYRIGHGPMKVATKVQALLDKNKVQVGVQAMQPPYEHKTWSLVVFGKAGAERAVHLIKHANFKGFTLFDPPHKIPFDPKSFSSGEATGH